MSQGQPPHGLNYATPVTPARRRYGSAIAVCVVSGLIVLFFLLMSGKAVTNTPASVVTFGQFATTVNVGGLVAATVDEDEVTFTTSSTLLPPSPSGSYRVQLPSGTGSDWRFLQWLTEAHPTPNNGRYASVTLATPRGGILINIVIPLIPWALIFVFLWFFLTRFLKKSRRTPMPVIIVNPEALK